MLDEEVGEHRVVGAVAAVAGGLDRAIRREDARDRLHVVAEVDDAHGERNRLALRMGGEALAVPALERERERLADGGREAEPLDEHVPDLAPRGEVVDGPLVRGLLEHLDDLVALLVGATRGGVGEDVAHHLGRVGGIVDERLGADRDLVAEQRRDLVGVTGAADVAEQRDPVGRLANVVVDLGGVADPGREQARAQLRLERLPEGVVLRERERGDEFGEAKLRFQDGVSSRCSVAVSRAGS